LLVKEEAMRLMTLAEAAGRLGVKVSSLRTEIRRGRLRPIEIARKFYLTEEAVKEMLDTCRAKLRGRGSISGEADPVDTGGSYSTVGPSVAQAAAQISLQMLKEHSRGTSQRSISRDVRQAISPKS
jgi:hypothetical protein